MMTVDILLYDGVDEMDFCGPLEALGSCRQIIDGRWSDKPVFQIETVSEMRSVIQCAHGLNVVPDKPLDRSREADIVIIPGGPGARREKMPNAILEFLQRSSHTADVIASVCTGAFILGKAGLIDGLRVTTHHAMLDELARQYPETKVVRGKRVVADGANNSLMSSAGISAGVDLALAIIARFESPQSATYVAKRLEWPGY